jgi:cytochrome c oxidase cbb3-type subunit IV
MDLITVRVAWTVATFVVFIAIVVWACSARAARGFEAAARLPFEDDVDDAAQRRGREGSGQ